MSRPLAFALAVATGLALVASGPRSAAYVPPMARIANAVAKVNLASGRGNLLRAEVELRFGEEAEPAATGTLWSNPEGMARLELVSSRGFVERHLIDGRFHRASRDGLELEEPQPLIPPLYLLQATSAGAVRGRLTELGADPSTVALGIDGEHDCFALGGRAPGAPPERQPPSLWLDNETLHGVRIDFGQGVVFRLGPNAAFGAIQLPEWIEIEAPGRPGARLTVVGASDAAPETSFDPSWLRREP